MSYPIPTLPTINQITNNMLGQINVQTTKICMYLLTVINSIVIQELILFNALLKDNEFIIINFYESKIYSEYLVNLVTVLLLKGSFAYFGFCLKL